MSITSVDQVAAITPEHLDQLEQIVRAGLQSFMATGLALLEIRESRGYKLRGFDTFEDYCQQTFNFTARHGRRMMQAAETTQEVIGATGDTLKRENMARALAPIARNAPALRHVKARLEGRGLSFGTAPAATVTGILREIRILPVAPRAKTMQGECPKCGEQPRAYRCIDGEWQCGSCGEPVYIRVSASPVKGFKAHDRR